jgi:hypothetical protein
MRRKPGDEIRQAPVTECILASPWAGLCLKFEDEKPVKVFIYMERSNAE